MVNFPQLILRDRVFLHSSCCPIIYYVDQTAELTEVFLLSPELRCVLTLRGMVTCGCHHPHVEIRKQHLGLCSPLLWCGLPRN